MIVFTNCVFLILFQLAILIFQAASHRDADSLVNQPSLLSVLQVKCKANAQFVPPNHAQVFQSVSKSLLSVFAILRLTALATYHPWLRSVLIIPIIDISLCTVSQLLWDEEWKRVEPDTLLNWTCSVKKWR